MYNSVCLLSPQNNTQPLMSKPLATKVSTPLSENVQIGPKVSIFCVAPIIFQHCLKPLRHGVHQSFTVCHWSPLPLLHDNITELVDVRDLALLCLPFEDAPQITFTLSFFSKAVVILEVCLGSLSCWNTALRPSLQRVGIMLCFSMSQYMLAFMVPSMCHGPAGVPGLVTRCLCVLSTWLVFCCWCHVLPCLLSAPAAISLRLQGKLSFPYNCQKMNGQIYVLLC